MEKRVRFYQIEQCGYYNLSINGADRSFSNNNYEKCNFIGYEKSYYFWHLP